MENGMEVEVEVEVEYVGIAKLVLASGQFFRSFIIFLLWLILAHCVMVYT
jgi:hypothetical protein